MAAENKKTDLISHKGQKRRAFTMEFKKTVVKFTMENSNRSAAKQFSLEPKRIREWRENFEKIISTKSSKQRLEGGGRKCFDADLEEKLVAWVYEQRSKMLHVSRKMIMFKAKKIFDDENQDPNVRETFVASRGWCEKLLLYLLVQRESRKDFMKNVNENVPLQAHLMAG